jgi:predicted anti-sigma-YlaC factor YlaD
MNHQPYENWIFAESDLSDEQLQELETHLNTCTECQQIRLDLRAASGLLQTAPMAAPVPGFAGRWQASLAERRALHQRQQTRRLLLALVGTALLLLLLLALHILATSTPVQWVVAGFQTTFSLFSTWNRIQDILLGLIGFIPPVVPIALWVMFTGGLSVLTLVWIISLWRISSQGASQK